MTSRSLVPGLAALALLHFAQRSGASPALITYGGDVVLGTFSSITMELAGPARGTGYDAMNIAGTLTFNGTLNVPLIGGFAPQAGNVFNLFDWGTKAGTFSTVNLPALIPGLLWSQANLYTAGEIAVALDPVFVSRTWDGGGANNDWATDANWTLDVQPLNNGTAQLIFAGSVRLTPSVDTPWNVASIVFNNSAGAFTITGPQGISVGAGGIVNNDTQTQTITAAVTLGTSGSFTTAAGDLVFTNVNIGTHTLTIAGANDATLDDVSGTGSVVKNDAGTLTVTRDLGTGGITFLANAGRTDFAASQTLEALNIGNGAVVVLSEALPPAPEGAPFDSASAFAAPAIPEPGTLNLFLAGALGLLSRWRRLATRHCPPPLGES